MTFYLIFLILVLAYLVFATVFPDGVEWKNRFHRIPHDKYVEEKWTCWKFCLRPCKIGYEAIDHGWIDGYYYTWYFGIGFFKMFSDSSCRKKICRSCDGSGIKMIALSDSINGKVPVSITPCPDCP